MEYMFPDYNKGLINVISSLEKYFGVKPKHNSLKLLDEVLDENGSKNVVLFLFDGLGYNLLCDNKDICPFLYKHLKGKISSNFPSTTMSARTTVESGLTPKEHGWLGWDMYFKKFDNVICLSKNVIKGTETKPANYHVGRTLLKYTPVTDLINEKNDTIGKTLRVYSNHKHESLRKMKGQIKRLTRKKEKVFVYAYYNEPDHVMHHYGTNDNLTIKYLKHIEKWFKKTCKSLKNTTVIAIADHGHIDVNYINLADYPNIIKMLDKNISIDDRATSFMVKKEYKKTFPIELKKVLKDDFIIMSKKEVIEKGLYGSGNENEYFIDGLGDYFALGISDKAIRYDNNKKPHKSAHSGLTLDEMLVPLIIVNSDKI